MDFSTDAQLIIYGKKKFSLSPLLNTFKYTCVQEKDPDAG